MLPMTRLKTSRIATTRGGEWTRPLRTLAVAAYRHRVYTHVVPMLPQNSPSRGDPNQRLINKSYGTMLHVRSGKNTR